MNSEPHNPRRKPQQKRAIDKVNKILQVARRLITEGGMEQLSTLNIAKEAGLPVGSVYSYFPNNMAIVHALSVQWLEDLRAQFDAIKHRDMSEKDWRRVFDEVLTIVYGAHETLSQRHFEMEMNKALSFYPELQEARKQHANAVADTMTDILLKCGTAWNRERLMRLSRFCYEVIGGLDDYLGLPDVDHAEALQWTRETLQHLITQCFDEEKVHTPALDP